MIFTSTVVLAVLASNAYAGPLSSTSGGSSGIGKSSTGVPDFAPATLPGHILPSLSLSSDRSESTGKTKDNKKERRLGVCKPGTERYNTFGEQEEPFGGASSTGLPSARATSSASAFAWFGGGPKSSASLGLDERAIPSSASASLATGIGKPFPPSSTGHSATGGRFPSITGTAITPANSEAVKDELMEWLDTIPECECIKFQPHHKSYDGVSATSANTKISSLGKPFGASSTALALPTSQGVSGIKRALPFGSTGLSAASTALAAKSGFTSAAGASRSLTVSASSSTATGHAEHTFGWCINHGEDEEPYSKDSYSFGASATGYEKVSAAAATNVFGTEAVSASKGGASKGVSASASATGFAAVITPPAGTGSLEPGQVDPSAAFTDLFDDE